ncbi:unnamed protein product [Fusarium graminearum]|uniref:Uncharacterized protein n=1 Tax=Gibberella zeae TaxID=5518 RepID=A0A4U9F3M2_GIBZA|nr:unnamed protein product [Fusarium graminearum]CAF3492937.1 unnamed protein product [Fusarium graminearum]CAG1986624.1 unnamed protein product [Fusarium graminearum]CAG1987315.1 unnamed protein product [Fusarium graminearum]CAG1995359.1 unnamed protein product [Fusarium graminearum]
MRRTISITLGQWTKGSPARCTAIQSLARGVETAKTPDTRGSERAKKILVRRVSSSHEKCLICGPLFSSNMTGELEAIPESGSL